jgi:hypothetical protein
MKRRKLTAAEVASIEVAKNALRMVPDDVIDEDVVKVISLLREVERHRTTDGKPCVEPQPEIGEGYRRATESDKDRRDRNHWDQQSECWYYSKPGIYAGNIMYRVPVDRIPTDEDAKQRPTVMVRGSDSPWTSRRLIAVLPGFGLPFIAVGSDGASYGSWKQARFPYPGELD